MRHDLILARCDILTERMEAAVETGDRVAQETCLDEITFLVTLLRDFRDDARAAEAATLAATLSP
jgi:hypothetical protein